MIELLLHADAIAPVKAVMEFVVENGLNSRRYLSKMPHEVFLPKYWQAMTLVNSTPMHVGRGVMASVPCESATFVGSSTRRDWMSMDPGMS